MTHTSYVVQFAENEGVEEMVVFADYDVAIGFVETLQNRGCNPKLYAYIYIVEEVDYT